MASKDLDDFRRAAVEESQRLFAQSGLRNPLNSDCSLCLPNAGDATGSLYRIALIPWLFLLPGLLLFLFGIVYAILILTPWVELSLKSSGIAVGAVTLGVIIFFRSEGVSNRLYNGEIRRWNGQPFVNDFTSRVPDAHHFCIEDLASYRKQKVISEDYALGGLDRSGRGLLLAGCQYQYILRPQDVIELREDKKVFLITVRIGDASLTLALSPLVIDDAKEEHFFDQMRTTLRPTVVSGV